MSLRSRYLLATDGVRSCRKTMAILGVKDFCIELGIEPVAWHGAYSDADLTTAIAQVLDASGYHGAYSDADLVILTQEVLEADGYHGAYSDADLTEVIIQILQANGYAGATAEVIGLSANYRFDGSGFGGATSTASLFTAADSKQFYGPRAEWEDYVPLASKYVITVTVKYKGRSWVVSREFAREVMQKIKTFANFIGVKAYRAYVLAKFSKKINKYIKVFARKKDE